MIDTTKIKEGMTIFDKNGDKIGTVEYVQYSDEDYNQPGVETATTTTTDDTSHLVKSLARALVDENDIPEVVLERLNHAGYIRMDSSSFLDSDYYVPMDMVTNVVGEDIHIRTEKDSLISA